MMVEIRARESLIGALEKKGGLVLEALRGEVARGVAEAVIAFGLLAGVIVWNPNAADRNGSAEDRQEVVAPKRQEGTPAGLPGIKEACAKVPGDDTEATRECILDISPVGPDEDDDD